MAKASSVPGPGGVRSWGLISSLEGWALVALFTYTAIALVGYVAFAMNPQNLPSMQFATTIYSVAFIFFSRAQIVVSVLVLLVVMARHSGTRWIPAFATVYFISFMAEHIGTGYGIPFSGYEYTAMLGPRLGPRVPIVIPMSWFFMAAPSWIIARAIFPSAGAWAGRIVVGSLLLVTWDLALDPAMSQATTYWLWETPGAFYGMPLVNLAGWMFTGLLIFSALEVLQRRIDWAGTVPLDWATAYYAGVLLMPLGMVTANLYWGSTVATLGACALIWGLYRVRAAAPADALPASAAPGAAPAPAAMSREQGLS